MSVLAQPTPRPQPARGWFFPVGLVLLVTAWLILFGSYGWMLVTRYCAEHFDFGIYVQAIAGFSWHDLNPWLSARGVHIFNDHFDPIVLTALLFRSFLSPSWAALVTEQTFILASLLPIAWLWAKGRLGGIEALTLCSLLLFSVGTVDAAAFPVHPTTWTLFPAMLLAVAWIGTSDVLLLVALLLFFSCKEEHVFCGPFLALGLLTQGRAARVAWAALLLSVLWGTFVFLLRPQLLGPTIPYLRDTLAEFSRAPTATLIASARAPELRRLGTLLVPFIPFAVWSARTKLAPSWALLLATLPLLASRFLAGKWAYQYGPPLIGLWVAALVPALAWRRVARWVPLATFILLATSLENPLRSAIARLSPSRPAACSGDPSRLEGLQTGVAYLHQHREDAALVSSTLVAPLADRPEIYALGSSQRLSRSPYRYLFLEKPPYGYDWPLSGEEVYVKIEAYRRQRDTRVIFENQYVLLAEGNF